MLKLPAPASDTASGENHHYPVMEKNAKSCLPKASNYIHQSVKNQRLVLCLRRYSESSADSSFTKILLSCLRPI